MIKKAGNNVKYIKLKNKTKMLLGFLLGILGGIFLFHITKQSWENTDYLKWLSIIDKMKNEQYQSVSVLAEIIRKRIILTLLIVFLIRVMPGMMGCYGLITYMGFSLGAFWETLITHFGIKGIVLSICLTIPHFIFYIKGFVMIGGVVMAQKEKQKLLAGRFNVVTTKKRELLRHIIKAIAFIVLGMLSEYYINLMLFRNILNMIW